MSTFHLPDLGEGLSEAEILRWHVAVGDTVQADQPLVSVETAKAVVEVPSPQTGVIAALHAAAGTRLETGAPLVEFAAVAGVAAGAAGAPAAHPRSASAEHAAVSDEVAGDSATVVGMMPTSGADYSQAAAAGPATQALQRIQAVPAARALARSLGVDLAALKGSGQGGLITLADVVAAGLPGRAAPAPASTMRPAALPDDDDSEMEELRSLRRAMSQSMSLSRDSVMECTVVDDADLHAWLAGNDYTVRVLRAIAVACRAEPGLNAWYDAASQARRLFHHVDVGLAVDTPDGLIVPVMRDVGKQSRDQLRTELERVKKGAVARTLRQEELRGFTFMLSNFGMLAGRYASPVVVPPAVAILGTGRARQDVVAWQGRIEIHPRMPLSLSFDHRVVTGGEAVRFLGALIRDLELPE
jgi:pyruvate dehydrogenase E2 component (dihydrolipoamide acetyltransferase)